MICEKSPQNRYDPSRLDGYTECLECFCIFRHGVVSLRCVVVSGREFITRLGGVRISVSRSMMHCTDSNIMFSKKM